MKTRQIFLRERCNCSDALSRRRRLLLGASAPGELGIAPLAPVVRFVVGKLLNVLVVVFAALWFGGDKLAHAQFGTVDCGCRHPITLFNATQDNMFEKVRVTAVEPGTEIVFASVGGDWTQVENYPDSVEWIPPPGSFVPTGTPIPNTFKIEVAHNNTADKHVLFEWVGPAGQTLCSQLLATPCPTDQEPFETEGSQTNDPQCLCVNAVIAHDPFSLELVEPDVDAAIDVPVRNSHLQYKFSNISEIDPLGTPVQTEWIVSEHDGLDEEQGITPPMIFDQWGDPTIDFPGPGVYTVYLKITAPDCSEEEIDVDFKTVTITHLTANFNWKQVYCNPKKIKFTDASSADETIVSWSWVLYNLNGTTSIHTSTDQNIEYLYANYPPSGQTYRVCLTVTDDVGNTSMEFCKDIFFGDPSCMADFDWSYQFCPIDAPPTVPFVDVSFSNDSTVDCPARFEWDFGDNTPLFISDTLVDPPLHVYLPGDYIVTLTIFDGPSPSTVVRCKQSKTLRVEPCTSDFTIQVCADCTVIFETLEPKPRRWEFPQGKPKKSRRSTRKVKYPAAGSYSATLTSTDSNGCSCSVTKMFEIKAADCQCCARNDRQKVVHYFRYDDHDYLMKYKFVQVNWFLDHHIKGKTKLKKKNRLGIYRASRAEEIELSWDGSIYKFEGKCACKDEHRETLDPIIRCKKSKVKETHHIGARFRTRLGSLTSTHTVKVDSAHPGVTKHLKLYKDCD